MKTIFFAPHSAIWVHAFPEALVAEALQQHGHRIVYVTCGGVFKRHCVPMAAHRMDPFAEEADKDRVCRECDAHKQLIRSRFGFEGFDIADILSTEDHAEADRIVAAASPESFLSIVLDDVEVGRAALSTFLLTFKRIRLEFSPREWSIFAIELRNTLLSFFACRKVLDRERPDRVILYSSGYSVNLVWCHLAQRRGIPFYYMNAGSNLSDRLQKVVIHRGHSLQVRLLDYWDRFQRIPCSGEVLGYVTDHLLELLRGRSSFVYSSPSGATRGLGIRERFGIAEHQKVLLATMSSYDEIFAARVTGLLRSDFPILFPHQTDWIRALMDYVRPRPDLFLVIRVHPREFPNKRDSVKSEHALELERLFAELPPNARVNWPTDEVSLYDLANVSDVCLNAWSSVGKELSLLGMPVVIYSPDLVFYPPDLNYSGTTTRGYFAEIERALREGWSFERSRRAYRWQALEDLYSRIDISDAYRFKEHQQRPFILRALNRLRRSMSPYFHQETDCKSRPRSMQAAKVISEIVNLGKDSVLEVREASTFQGASLEEETVELRRQLRRVGIALAGGERNPARRGNLSAHLLQADLPVQSTASAQATATR
jgi:hypothetical protein